GRKELNRVGRAVDSSRVGFEVLGHSQRPNERLLLNVALFTVGEVVDKGERGNKLAVLGQMALERGGEFITAQATLEPLAPCQKLCRRGIVESEKRNLVIGALHGPQLERLGLVEFCEPGEHVPSSVPGARIGIAVDVLPLA